MRPTKKRVTAAVFAAVHEFREHHEGVNRSLKLVAASALHLEQTCRCDGRELIAQLVAEASPRWPAVRFPKTELKPAVVFVATTTLVAVLAAFEHLGQRLESAGCIELRGKPKPTTTAGWIAKKILTASESQQSQHQHLAVLANYFGHIRNGIAHTERTVKPDNSVRTAFNLYGSGRRKGLPALPSLPGHLDCEQVILASALCHDVSKTLL